ncbi:MULTISPECIES: hypothetical protein [Cellulomonas]|uniref:Uncharacterized protein n=1 Tax=Cellulomonas gilvus (strain ATCC 13127 / NRRL B-14078) TaxID=593907 RepID=F8A0K9_CELGA|nr:MULTISPECIES: hypothetical protein [Cellulomonas]AEI12694.1 hypothetical protein Celgi_2194 [Cellulomonas gilvus ATCC 13127]MCR6689553.1 hypothetical protein [Cellulomonas sp.]
MTSKRTIRTWVVIDAVLVTVLVVLLVATLGGPSGSPGAPASTTATPTAAATGSAAPAKFRLPSGNIACTMAPSGVTCTIASITYEPPAVPGCAGDTGHVLVLNDDGFAFDCVDGPAPTVAGDDVPVLEYGSKATSGPYVCTSATDGVSCVDDAGTGFKLARAAWSELP